MVDPVLEQPNMRCGSPAIMLRHGGTFDGGVEGVGYGGSGEGCWVRILNGRTEREREREGKEL